MPHLMWVSYVAMPGWQWRRIRASRAASAWHRILLARNNCHLPRNPEPQCSTKCQKTEPTQMEKVPNSHSEINPGYLFYCDCHGNELQPMIHSMYACQRHLFALFYFQPSLHCTHYPLFLPQCVPCRPIWVNVQPVACPYAPAFSFLACY